jgi:hypothetical protein
MMRMSLQNIEKVGHQEKVHEKRELFLFLMIPPAIRGGALATIKTAVLTVPHPPPMFSSVFLSPVAVSSPHRTLFMLNDKLYSGHDITPKKGKRR